MKSKISIVLSGLLIIMTGFVANATSFSENPAGTVCLTDPAELIINLTSDVTASPQSSLMALHFAEKALENGLKVTIFMNVMGVKLASKDAASIEFNGENLHGIIKSIIAKGGNVVACPMCMKIQGISENDLADGINVSSPGMMMQKLQESPTVFTY
ncbi:DsrE family protein [Fulvivirga sedimenti]|uniref:DsrE family protein n=1 Tax=Fulvivirga sedimenti TaxID=2879465 RepID=A0A9X1HVP4_9BACT|nr:DsrE family protein [Fulvivirga sedimenti]MCA6079123.1 DsrE family protein [Fulvivirga sedimenti]